mmetsp:Transcript_20509/g.54364  ORF Transcript_20509/g.54364 Transcript_20509/m.54364 type:complete len:213 (+) Transcript_20509:338-976(+)
MPAQLSAGGQLHDGLHDVAVVCLQGRNGLAARALHLGHDELDVLRLDAGLVDVALVNFLDGDGLGGILRRCSASAAELLGRLRHGVLTQVLDLGLPEDDVGVRARRLEDVRVGDDEEDVLALLHGDAGDARHRLHPQLLHRLAALLLGPVLLRRPGPAARCLKVGHVLIGVIVAARLLNLGVGLRLGHCCRRSEGAGEATGRVPAMSTALSA